ncbi:YIP1 family protein [Natronococcus sp. A-GB1]|uniref:YIP1 family protein n=1 Tax=Natronococcus sp. A-GB1 TaxID=3037648 RepID=UPI00241E08B4|nr:YIP1 family protein [Natronococcus sp. A-GB1]MDG5759219.1 YIP1 family protein [Natronococcus sp. A-GB1]
MTKPSTPLVDPDGYFARADAFSLPRAAGLVVAYWLGSLAVDLGWWLAGDLAGDPVTLLSALQQLEATLLYWVVPTVVLYGLVLVVGAEGEPAETLSLAAWGLVPLLAGMAVFNLALAALATLGVDPGAIPSDPNVWLFAPLALLACGWAAYVWRGGLAVGFGLERSSATATALLAGGVCAVMLVFPTLV